MNCEACLKTWNIYQSAWGPIDEAGAGACYKRALQWTASTPTPFPRSTELKRS